MANKGICKLTGEHGAFVKAHLLPLAFTKPAYPGAPMVQGSGQHRPVRRWTSWYDARLVTQAGEDILKALDSWAIAELRRLKLVWSGWGPMLELVPSEVVPGSTWGIREIVDVDLRRLRLFFLSLLWRAAATNLKEFSEIELPADDLEALRRMIVVGDPDPASFYSVQLTQLSTLGPPHNLTPLASEKWIPDFEAGGGKTVPIFRFYFDGLSMHFHRPLPGGNARDLGPLVVGADDKLIVTTVPYEESFEQKNLDRVVAETIAAWPTAMTSLVVSNPRNRRARKAGRKK